MLLLVLRVPPISCTCVFYGDQHQPCEENVKKRDVGGLSRSLFFAVDETERFDLRALYRCEGDKETLCDRATVHASVCKSRV